MQTIKHPGGKSIASTYRSTNSRQRHTKTALHSQLSISAYRASPFRKMNYNPFPDACLNKDFGSSFQGNMIYFIILPHENSSRAFNFEFVKKTIINMGQCRQYNFFESVTVFANQINTRL